MNVTVRQKLVESGVEAQADCINLHSGLYPDALSSPGNDYVGQTLWAPVVDPGTEVASFMAYPFNAKEYRDKSKVRCVALRFDQPFNGLRDIKFWIDEFTIPSGWEFEVSVNASWQQHRQQFRPITEFFTAPVANLMPGFDTRLDVGAMTIEPYVSSDGSEHYSNWVSIRATAYSNAATGPLLGVDSSGLARPMIWNFSWRGC